jgi:hypothetical protein
MSSLRLKQLVAEVLGANTPHDAEDVIEHVFVEIETKPQWRKKYDAASYDLGKDSAVAWTGFWVSHLTQRTGDQRQPAARSTLIESFTRLVAPADKRGKKLKEPEAVQAMHEHFTAHRETLPASVREHRDVIVDLIMDGITPEAAFTKALAKPMFAWR